MPRTVSNSGVLIPDTLSGSNRHNCQLGAVRRSVAAEAGLLAGLKLRQHPVVHRGVEAASPSITLEPSAHKAPKANGARVYRIGEFTKADPNSTGPASLMLTDPDGNPVLIDQHVPKPK